MKIGLVVHGPEVIDSGEAKKVLEKLSESLGLPVESHLPLRNSMVQNRFL
ncbi:DUF2117 domain-containing protein [Methanosarcina sp. UBA5]|nr:DUF2117 domain-containing protein [Methanosarcina sp. UBA5]